MFEILPDDLTEEWGTYFKWEYGKSAARWNPEKGWHYDMGGSPYMLLTADQPVQYEPHSDPPPPYTYQQLKQQS
jgi:hypothetical protein